MVEDKFKPLPNEKPKEKSQAAESDDFDPFNPFKNKEQQEMESYYDEEEAK